MLVQGGARFIGEDGVRRLSAVYTGQDRQPDPTWKQVYTKDLGIPRGGDLIIPVEIRPETEEDRRRLREQWNKHSLPPARNVRGAKGRAEVS
jgi:hypothetical protein